MEYRITKEELGNDWLYSTLIALDKCMAAYGLPLYVVGAIARDVAMKLMKGDEPKRRTEDLDVAIAIENWQAFDGCGCPSDALPVGSNGAGTDDRTTEIQLGRGNHQAFRGLAYRPKSSIRRMWAPAAAGRVLQRKDDDKDTRRHSAPQGFDENVSDV